MIIDRRLIASGIVAAALCGPYGAAVADETVRFVYLQRDNDPLYAESKAYTGLVLRDRKPPVDGAKLAIKDSKVIGRSLGLSFELVEKTLGADADAVDAVRQAAAESGLAAIVLDLPHDDMVKIGQALRDQPLILINTRETGDDLRGANCSPVLYHSIPSDAMLTDALAQYLYKQNWTKTLVLVGEASGDAVLSEAFQASARKFGLKVVDIRPFVLGEDPRQRGENNVRLLTSQADYDVVFLADTVGEFGRYVPYQTLLPRPVVGSEGLVADAWDWTFERQGAPQLNRRFEKAAGRHMSAFDWAAWAGVKAIVEAISRIKTTEPDKLRAYLTSDALNLDTYKGAPNSFRPWDHQLRQPILLHTANAVIARAPIDGFLHRSNNLDTLGIDQPETKCRM